MYVLTRIPHSPDEEAGGPASYSRTSTTRTASSTLLNGGMM